RQNGPQTLRDPACKTVEMHKIKSQNALRRRSHSAKPLTKFA
ncbi:25145_t:CDS:2, partial [Racocetra persica]